MASVNGGIIRGINYSVGQSFKVAEGSSGSAQANGGGSTASTKSAGTTVYYRKHDTSYETSGNPIAICGTNNAWVDGWYPIKIMPRATYTITLNHGGDSSNKTSVTKTWGVSLTLPTPTRANATANGYTVTYSPGNGSSNTSTTVQNTTKYTFTGWTEGSSSVSTTYNPSEPNFGGSTAANKTFTAGWSSSTTNGSVTLPTPTWANTSASGTITYNASTNGGTTTKSSENFSTSTTHTFNGWYNSSGTKIGNAGASYTPTANITLTGKWTNTTTGSSTVTLPTASKSSSTSSRTVTINANGGSSTVTSRTSSATVTYTSTGWWTAASGGTKVGNNGATITPSTAPITYYAQFSSSTGSYSAVTLPTTAQCTRTNHVLKGFSTSSTATTATYAPGASITPSGNTTLYAVWESLVGYVYVKKDGAWVQAKAVYTKVNGAWV